MSWTRLNPALIAAFSGFTALPERLVSMVMFISNAIGLHGNARPAAAPAVNALYARLRLMLRRLNGMMIRYKAGRPMQRAAARIAPRPATRRAPAAPAYRLPATPGWLQQAAPPGALYAGWLTGLMDDKDLAGLAEASPQARRLLRPLWRMMGLTPPAELALPPRPRRPARPRRAKPPPPEPPPPAPPSIPPVQRWPDWPPLPD